MNKAPDVVPADMNSLSDETSPDEALGRRTPNLLTVTADGDIERDQKEAELRGFREAIRVGEKWF